MYQVFNMGIGMVLIVPKKHEAEVARKTGGRIIGESSKVLELLRWYKAGRSREARSSPQTRATWLRRSLQALHSLLGRVSRGALRSLDFDRHF